MVCTMDPGRRVYVISSPSWQGSDRRPQKVTILEKSKRVVWRDPSGPGSCEGGIFTAARNKVSHFNDSQQTSCAAWGK